MSTSLSVFQLLHLESHTKICICETADFKNWCLRCSNFLNEGTAAKSSVLEGLGTTPVGNIENFKLLKLKKQL
jgi:hypothetical protein